MTDKEVRPCPVSDRRRFKFIALTRGKIFTLLTVAYFGIASSLYAVKATGEGLEESATTEGINTMFLAQQHAPKNDSTQPIATSAPAGTETATFALG
ncbi:MAG TPA: hypothetical protein VK463_05790 [Desulfomonilaceae bacterium]|nr:hypothetical protein [Desulfomonilaceae bacterium]